jgi:hypothetical protein
LLVCSIITQKFVNSYVDFHQWDSRYFTNLQIIFQMFRHSNIYDSMGVKSSLDDFEFLMVLGQGAYGKVLKV